MDVSKLRKSTNVRDITPATAQRYGMTQDELVRGQRQLARERKIQAERDRRAAIDRRTAEIQSNLDRARKGQSNPGN